MGKIEENKQQKLETLFQSAYDLFLAKGIEDTSISDITKKAGVAKGTFYLYFHDKYEIRDRLIAKTSGELFLSAYHAVEEAGIPSFEDKIIFVVDYILGIMQKNKRLLRFVSKNLSWGMFHKAIMQDDADSPINVMDIYQDILVNNPEVKLKAPETMMFLIIELAGSASFSTILDNDPIPFDELQPYLNQGIRAIIRNHVVAE